MLFPPPVTMVINRSLFPSTTDRRASIWALLFSTAWGSFIRCWIHVRMALLFNSVRGDGSGCGDRDGDGGDGDLAFCWIRCRWDKGDTELDGGVGSKSLTWPLLILGDGWQIRFWLLGASWPCSVWLTTDKERFRLTAGITWDKKKKVSSVYQGKNGKG